MAVETVSFSVSQNDLRFLILRTYFSMAQQDVRYYLNGMLLEVKGGTLRTVATDGHRMALNTLNDAVSCESEISALLPYKGVIELMRLLQDDDTEISVEVSGNHIRVTGPNFIFTSKLIDGSFPSYERVLPKNGDKVIEVDRLSLKQTLQRVAILTNDKFRSVRVHLADNIMAIQANNPEQEIQ